MSSKKIAIQTFRGFRAAKQLASNGDYAIASYHGAETLTHLPTGAIVAKLDDGNAMDRAADAMVSLADVPRFDVQSFESVKAHLEAALARHGLAAAWRDG